MTHIPEKLRRLVKERANFRCEYCLIHEEDTFQPLHIDHIYAEKHDGETIEENLCSCCSECNRHKGSDIASLDPVTKQITPFFHPRLQQWTDHFRLNGAFIEPLTPEGRVTVKLLQINKEERLMERIDLMKIGRYPRL